MAQEVDIGLPQDLRVQTGYTLRVTALDSSGALVAGVKISTVVITADDGGGDGGDGSGGGGLGQWFLVPGINA